MGSTVKRIVMVTRLVDDPLIEQALSSLIQSCFSLPSGFQLPAQVVCAAQAAAPTALQEAKAFSKGGKVKPSQRPALG